MIFFTFELIFGSNKRSRYQDVEQRYTTLTINVDTIHGYEYDAFIFHIQSDKILFAMELYRNRYCEKLAKWVNLCTMKMVKSLIQPRKCELITFIVRRVYAGNTTECSDCSCVINVRKNSQIKTNNVFIIILLLFKPKQLIDDASTLSVVSQKHANKNVQRIKFIL